MADSAVGTGREGLRSGSTWGMATLHMKIRRIITYSWAFWREDDQHQTLDRGVGRLPHADDTHVSNGDGP